MLGELIIDEPDQDGRLSHSRIANDHCLVKVIELLNHTLRIINKIMINLHQDYYAGS